MSGKDTTPRTLICAECGGQSSRGARGWRAYLGGDGAKNDPLDVFQRIIFEGAQIDIVADVPDLRGTQDRQQSGTQWLALAVLVR